MNTRLLKILPLVTTLALVLMALPMQSAQSTTLGVAPKLKEVLASSSGADTTEFVELYGEAGGSLDGVSLIVVESDNGLGLGQIDLRIDFGPADTLGTNGFYLVGNPVGLDANYGVVPNLEIGDNSLENNSLTVALVETSSLVGSSVSGGEVVLDAVGITDGGAGDTFYFGAPVIGPDGGFTPAGVRRVANGVDTDTAADWVFSDFYLGPANSPTRGDTCGDAFTPIHAIQGNSSASPLVGTVAVIEGVVVGDFQNNASADDGDLNGFNVQAPEVEVDADPSSSEGIFVFAPGSEDVSVGDRVRVRGTVAEFNGLTEIADVTALLPCTSGNALPTAATLSLPVTSVDAFEAYEGMLVAFPQALYISEYFNFDRFGEIVLTSERHLAPTAEFEPGAAALQAAAGFLLDRITLDDGRLTQNPDPAIHPNGTVFDLANRFRGGDTVQSVTGVLDFAFGLYRVQPTQGAVYASANPRPTQPEDVGGTLKIASFNALNYFTTPDGSGPICGPLRNLECRGADNEVELTRQRAKIIAALAAMNADVVGLIEVENHPGDGPTADLVDGLNAVLGAGTYAYIATGPIGDDAIRQAFIYRPASVTAVGAYAILDSTVDPRFLDEYSRPALAQSFRDATSGGIFTVAVNQLKSKGSSCDAIGDPDTGDGQGNCNLTRKTAAEALVDWLATDPTGSGDEDFLIIGDLNSYDKEDPIDGILKGADDTLGTGDDYADLLFQFQGEGAYTYLFDGQVGYLDHALASSGLKAKVTGATAWHVNADEPDLLDYDTTFKAPAQVGIYAPDAYRSSDHDPVIVGLNVCEATAPTFDAVSVTPNTLWPADHKYRDVTATVVVEDDFDLTPIVTLVSVTSNEPDDGKEDGNTKNDIVIVDDFHFKLRAERSGIGTGRIYTITYLVTDACGNSTTQSVTVSVPLSGGM